MDQNIRDNPKSHTQTKITLTTTYSYPLPQDLLLLQIGRDLLLNNVDFMCVNLLFLLPVGSQPGFRKCWTYCQ